MSGLPDKPELIQRFPIKSRNFLDLGWNFLISTRSGVGLVSCGLEVIRRISKQSRMKPETATIIQQANIDILAAVEKLNRLRGDDLMMVQEEKLALEDAEANLRGLLK